MLNYADLDRQLSELLTAPGWCVPCQRLEPHISAVTTQLAGKCEFITIDVDKNPIIAKNFDVMSVPTVIQYNNDAHMRRTINSRTAVQLVKELELTWLEN